MPHQTGAHRRFRLIEHPQQRAVFFALGVVFYQFQISYGDGIEREKFVSVVQFDGRNVIKRTFLRFFQVFDKRARGGYAVFFARDSVRRQRGGFELFQKVFFRVFHVERPRNVTGKRRQRAVADFFDVSGTKRHVVVTDDFRHGITKKQTDRFRERLFSVPLKFGNEKFARRDIRPCDGDAFRRFGNAGDIIVLRFVEQRIFYERAGGNDADDVAFHQSAPRRFRIGKLFADSHLFAQRYQFGDVSIDGVIRNAAHRRALLKPAVARGER